MTAKSGRPDSEPSISPFGADFASKLIESSPLAFLVLDGEANIRFASARAGALVGHAPVELIGQSILEYVHPDDVGRCADIFSFGREYTQSIMGPVHIRYVDASGQEGYVDLWANNCLEDDTVGGIVCVLNGETTSSRLADAVSAIAANRPIEVTFRTVAEAMRGDPVEGVGVIFGIVDDDVAALTPHSLPEELCGLESDGPWIRALETGTAVDIEDLTQLGPEMHAKAVELGFQAVWARPITITEGGPVQAVLVVWSRLSGAPSPNQEDHLHEGVSIVSLAFGRVMLIEQLTHDATHDELTGVGNRSKLYASVDADLNRPITVLYLDLDGFKAINDRLGHEAGDLVLMTVANRISETLREHDEVARVGGDEFVVILRQLPNPPTAERVIERIRMAVSHPIDVGDEHVSVAVSIGIAHGFSNDDFSELVRQADSAMYEAKAARRIER